MLLFQLKTSFNSILSLPSSNYEYIYLYTRAHSHTRPYQAEGGNSAEHKNCRRFSLIIHNIFHLTETRAMRTDEFARAQIHTHVHHVISLK